MTPNTNFEGFLLVERCENRGEGPALWTYEVRRWQGGAAGAVQHRSLGLGTGGRLRALRRAQRWCAEAGLGAVPLYGLLEQRAVGADLAA